MPTLLILLYFFILSNLLLRHQVISVPLPTFEESGQVYLTKRESLNHGQWTAFMSDGNLNTFLIHHFPGWVLCLECLSISLLQARTEWVSQWDNLKTLLEQLFFESLSKFKSSRDENLRWKFKTFCFWGPIQNVNSIVMFKRLYSKLAHKKTKKTMHMKYISCKPSCCC